MILPEQSLSRNASLLPSQLYHLVSVTALSALAAAPRGGGGAGGGRVPFGELLRAVEEVDPRSCDRDEKGCGLVQPLRRRLREVPPLFTVMLSWESRAAEPAALRALLDAVDTTLRVRIRVVTELQSPQPR